jgi:hypothetical protein
MEEGSSKRKRFQFDNVLIWFLIVLVIASVVLMILEWPKLLPLSASLRSRLEADYGSSSLMETIGVLRLQIIEDVFRDLGLPIDLSIVETEEPVPTATSFEPLDTETATPTLENTATPTGTRTPTRTPLSTSTPSKTATSTWTPIPPTATKTRKPPTPRPPTWTFTPSVTPTPSNTPTPSDTPTPTNTFTPTPTFTPSITPTPTPADSSAPYFGEVVFVLTQTGGDQCRVTVEYANVFDPAISYGIGPNGIGDRNGFVRVFCGIGGEESFVNLAGNDGGYVPYGEWNAVYSGSVTCGPIDATTVITYRARARDNSRKTRDTQTFTNTGCQD